MRLPVHDFTGGGLEETAAYAQGKADGVLLCHCGDRRISVKEKQEGNAEYGAAEAGLKIGGEQATKGMEYLNDVITNRTTNTAMKVNAAADFTLERILKERRKELVGEGLAVYDYTRNKLPVVRKGSWHLTSLETSNAYTIQPNDSRLAIPIPQTEIDANPNLVQNP